MEIPYKINKNVILVGGRQVQFEYEIMEVAEIGGFLVVLLDIPNEVKDVVDNVFGVNKVGQLSWQIQDLRESYPYLNDVPYIGIRIDELNQIKAIKASGVFYYINPTNGKIIGHGSSK